MHDDVCSRLRRRRCRRWWDYTREDTLRGSLALIYHFGLIYLNVNADGILLRFFSPSNCDNDKHIFHRIVNVLGKSSRRLFSHFECENNYKKTKSQSESFFPFLKSNWTALTACHGLMFSAYKLICWVSEWAIRLWESNACFEWDFIKLKFTLCCHSDCDEHWSFAPSVDYTYFSEFSSALASSLVFRWQFFMFTQ